MSKKIEKLREVNIQLASIIKMLETYMFIESYYMEYESSEIKKELLNNSNIKS